MIAQPETITENYNGFMKTIIYPVLVIFIVCSIASGQIIIKHEKIRAGFGVSGILNDEFNTHIDELQRSAALLGPELNIGHFKDHFTFFFEYENESLRRKNGSFWRDNH